MSEINVNLAPTSLDVYGGPASLDVSLDYGPKGNRGSRIWVGNGNPESTLLGQDEEILVGDWFINTNTTDPFYSWMYLYTESVSGPAWEPALRLNPSQYSTIADGSFGSNGIATINIPVKALTADTTVLKEKFIIRYSIENQDSNPVSSSFEYGFVTENSILKIQIMISAIKYSGSTWSNLTGAHKVHLFISYQR
jgi:hypothetical protein